MSLGIFSDFEKKRKIMLKFRLKISFSYFSLKVEGSVNETKGKEWGLRGHFSSEC